MLQFLLSRSEFCLGTVGPQALSCLRAGKVKPHPWGAEEPWVYLFSHSPLSLFHAGFSLTGTCLMPSEQPAGEQPQACAGLLLLWILEGTATAAAGCMNPGPKTALLPTGGLWRARSLVSFPETQDHSSALPTKLWSERLGPTSPQFTGCSAGSHLFITHPGSQLSSASTEPLMESVC